VSFYIRYFADGVVSLKAIANGLKAIDPSFKIDGGELTRGPEMLGEVEINGAGSDLFGEEIQTQAGALNQIGGQAAQWIVSRLQHTQSVVVISVLDGDRDPAVTWELLQPIWTVLPGISPGLTYVDGQGFYEGPQLILQM
jgi:hypothetical protein